PSAAVSRLRALASDEWSGWRMALVPFVLLGVATASAELWFAIACAATLFVAYLSYGHWPGWTLYYFEAIPVAALCAANGIRVFWRWMQSQKPSPVLVRTPGWGLAALLVFFIGLTITTWRNKHVTDAGYDTGFKKMVASAPFPGVVVFV